MKKEILQNTTLSGFDQTQVFTIVSGESDLKVCWIINSLLDINLSLSDDIVITSRKNSINFRRYQFISHDEFERYILMVNRHDGNILVPELKKIDYLFIIQSQVSLPSLETRMLQVKKHPLITALIQINYQSIKSFNRIPF